MVMEEVEVETRLRGDWKDNLPKATRDLIVMQIIDVLKIKRPRYRTERSYLIIARRIENRCFRNAKDEAHYSTLIDEELMSEEELAFYAGGGTQPIVLEPRLVNLCTPLPSPGCVQPHTEDFASSAKDNITSKRPEQRLRKPKNPVRSPLQ